MERPDATTLRRVGALLGVLAGAVYLVLVWLGSTDIRSDLLEPAEDRELPSVEIASVVSDRIGLVRSPLTEQPGTWGLRSEGAFGIAGEVVELREDVVVRAFELVEGAFSIGAFASWDAIVFRGDPASAFGIDFQSVRIPGELGVNPAWFIDGRQDTWVIVVHGRDAGLEQSLRLVPALADADYPIVVASYRGDGLAPAARTDRYTWGVEEWPEVADAVRWAQSQGAQGVALVGFGMGASVVAQFLHESTLLPVVRGVMFDSPVLDLEATSDANAADDGIPAFLHAPAKAVARLRFNLEWSVLDHVGRAAEFDVPILVIQGSADRVAPSFVATEFQSAVGPDLVTLNIVDGAAHETVWNTNPGRYEFAMLQFLEEVTPGR